MGIPLALLHAETNTMAEAILTLDLLSKSEQRKAVADLKARLVQASDRGYAWAIEHSKVVMAGAALASDF